MDLTETYQMLIVANHILHYNKVLDAYGHISVRHPTESGVFIMSSSVAPALVSSPSDLVSYRISDSSPVNPKAKKGYQERFIHSEIYKQFPAIHSIIHSHAEAVLPYTISGVPMRPAFHIAGFLGTQVPIWDIVGLYKPEDHQDMLVNSERFGSSLAASFGEEISGSHDHTVVLMANHGFTAVGNSIQQAVYRAVYTTVNAGVQSNALLLRQASASIGDVQGDIRFLSQEQTRGSLRLNDASQDRPWDLWVREVAASPLYQICGLAES
ncbi:hypothetical protein PVAG01_05581 [Phlyctema vagabunda]|uniref:Class II aldolase/adducin N-terminal domain-containing protein n=1 Tax=Phlyctema vagabunda TaxID=108571 RepID=A0ABR4PKI2_9HELO